MDKFNEHSKLTDYSLLENLFLKNGTVKEYKKKEFFIRRDETSHYIGFIESGIFRYTREDAKANDRIVGYSFAGDFVCDYPSLIYKAGSLVHIQAATDCKIYLLSRERLENYWEGSMDTQRLGRKVTEEIFIEIYKRLLGFYCDTPEQRYVLLMKRCPNLQKQIALKEIASFIGVTPETVSHIRRNISKIEKS